MEKAEKTANKRQDMNGNSPNFGKIAKKKGNGVTPQIKDHITMDDGRVFYPCRFCNKVFRIKKTRAIHVRQCSAKEYIMSVGEGSTMEKQEPVNPPPKKIDIQQNIVLRKEVDVQKSPPIKLTIKRSPSNGSKVLNHFTVSNNSLVLKEKNEDEFMTSIAKKLESNSVTIIKQPKEDSKLDTNNTESNEEIPETNEKTCRECTKEFRSQLELLRHSRKCHKYPKVMMAMCEVKKFYATKDRSECPICHKPLKTIFKSAFVKHLDTHTNEMKYSCHVCKKKFRRADHMKAHEKRHIIEK